MSSTSYPDQTRFGFRVGSTFASTVGGVRLLDPTHREELADLTPAQLQALQQLKQRAATLAEMGGPNEQAEIGSVIDRLNAGGWLTTTVRDGGKDCYSIVPFARPAPPPPAQSSEPTALSKFAVLHRDREGFVLEHPLGWCDVRIHDSDLLALLDGSIESGTGSPPVVASHFLQDLRRCGFLIPAGEEDRKFDSSSWSAPDLWFHRRSTLGRRDVTWEHFGPTMWAKGRFPQPSARPRLYPGAPIPLHVPDLNAKRIQDPTLTTVLEDRFSERSFDETNPIRIDELGELLYRTARTRETLPLADGQQLASRPYPSAGSVYELELYPVARNVAGLEPGMYHYDSFDHALRPVANAESRAVSQLIGLASATLARGAEPQLLIVMAARCGRIMWTYEQVSYALILKDVGVLMQTIHLAATAMGLGACAQGFGDTAAFVEAAGVDELQECSVGSIVVGSAAPD
ncbi:SagB family peptide dehydrogenase [Mycobacterium asiaticum]|uniref:Dehydrogenase n=1 Tax=Mycobacterium asiaticum TaxID=1790 RepID=A0A1A3L2E3_MYCAS|nr:SagB family peptide dehydrogenase [Mycobacterium asiaticum]OBJ90336.1 dehydrogenase [Mycobacterium asiaticum]